MYESSHLIYIRNRTWIQEPWSRKFHHLNVHQRITKLIIFKSLLDYFSCFSIGKHFIETITKSGIEDQALYTFGLNWINIQIHWWQSSLWHGHPGHLFDIRYIWHYRCSHVEYSIWKCVTWVGHTLLLTANRLLVLLPPISEMHTFQWRHMMSSKTSTNNWPSSCRMYHGYIKHSCVLNWKLVRIKS